MGSRKWGERLILSLAAVTFRPPFLPPTLIAIQLHMRNLRQRLRERRILRRKRWDAFRAASPRERLFLVLNACDRAVAGIGFYSALIILPAMIGVRVYDIVARKLFNAASPLPLYLEWELFVFLVLLTLAYAHVRGAHVRVDVIRERLSPRAQGRIELLGLLLLIIPFALVVLYFGIHYTAESFNDGEKLALALGAPGRWLLKGAMPFGLGLFLLAAVVAAVRNLAQRRLKD